MYRKLDLNSLKPHFNGLFVHVYFMLQIMTENDQGKFLKQCEVFVDIVEGKGNHQVSIIKQFYRSTFSSFSYFKYYKSIVLGFQFWMNIPVRDGNNLESLSTLILTKISIHESELGLGWILFFRILDNRMLR